MQAPLQKILVVGGNGFIGSAVCKAALARGMEVVSMSSSGRPYQTPKGHTPAWASKVEWHAADALRPETYAHLMPGLSGVVHTLGVLLEDTEYKRHLREGNVPALLGSFFKRGGNPLKPEGDGAPRVGGYETINRDSALRVCETFLAAPSDVDAPGPRPFVYVSAEDVFRPLVPEGYIRMKREAEARIAAMIADKPAFRGVYIRPSLVYHAHYRPMTSPVAALLGFSASMHAKASPRLPTPSRVLRALAARSAGPAAGTGLVHPSPLDSLANILTIPPIHVEHVAEAISVAADVRSVDVEGPLGVHAMRALIGWKEKGLDAAGGANEAGLP